MPARLSTDLSISGLFLKLIDRNVPKIFLDIIINWYQGLSCRVRWDNHFSEWFHISAGVRQGGILSPDFYSLYVDKLIYILKSSGAGCYFLSKFAAALVYADDMALLAPSIKGLQRLLTLCESYCREWDIQLNIKKTKNLSFGKGPLPEHKLKLNGGVIEWMEKWPYLGVTLQSGPRFSCCVKEKISKFCCAANAVLRVEGCVLRLLEYHCVSILTYAIEIVHVADEKQRKKLRVAYNSIFRNLYNYTRRQSVTELQHALDRHTWEELIEERCEKFKLKTKDFPLHSIVRYIGQNT